MKLCETCRYGSEYELDKPCIVYREDCRYYRKVGEDMTREQAIITLKVVDENASCDDCLYYNQMEDCPDNEDCIIRQALEMSIKALEQEPCNTDTCKVVKAFMNDWDKPNNSDAISRQAVLDVLEKEGHKWGNDYRDWVDAIEEIKKLPPVNPQPKTGHWIEKDGFDGDTYYDCSECGESWTTIEGTPWDNEWNYCPNCGCRMIEPQESEVNNG